MQYHIAIETSELSASSDPISYDLFTILRGSPLQLNITHKNALTEAPSLHFLVYPKHPF